MHLSKLEGVCPWLHSYTAYIHGISIGTHNPAISGQHIHGFLGFLRQYPFLGMYVACVHDWEHDLSVDILCVKVCVLGTLY
jgi:hypothetical protein